MFSYQYFPLGLSVLKEGNCFLLSFCILLLSLTFLFQPSDISVLYLHLQMSVYARGVSVLMPGEEIPTFIAHRAPAPCPPEGITRPLHQM